MDSISSRQGGRSSITPATCPLGSTPRAGSPCTIACWMIMGALADITAWAVVISASRLMATADLSRAVTPIPVWRLKASPLRRAISRRRSGPARSSDPSSSFRIMRCGMPSMARDTMIRPGSRQST